MKKLNLSRSICLTFAHDAEPGTAFQLNKESTDKLGELPSLLRALAICYGANIGEPIMWGGDIHLEISKEPDLFNFSDSMIDDVLLSAQEVVNNSLCQPPKPLAQAVTHRHCIKLLRTLSKAFEKTKLVAEIHVGGKIVELPHVPMAAFTEPETTANNHRYINAKVRGLCVPMDDANVIIMDDMNVIELPLVDYAFDLDEIYQRVVKCEAVFIGPVEITRKGVYRALPGGSLEAQHRL